jgi:hypothetical protein
MNQTYLGRDRPGSILCATDSLFNAGTMEGSRR